MLGNEKQAEEQAKYAEDTLKQARDFAKQHHKTAYLLGASFLLLTDTLARTIAPIELPLGILTSACGAPFFLYLLVRGQK